MPAAPLAHAALAVALSAAKIAIVSSSNEASGQPSLRYAERDADKMAAVLGELGSFDGGNLWMIRHASAPALRQALQVG